MNNIQLYIILVALGWLSSYLFDWWVLNPLAFVLGIWVHNQKTHIFYPSMLAGFTLWFLMAAYQVDFDIKNTILLKSSMLFNIPNILLLIIIGVIGGLLAGFGASAGYYFRNLFKKSVAN